MSGPATRETTAAAGAGRRRVSKGARKVAVLKGGSSLERSVSLRSGAQVEDALQRWATRWSAIDAGRSSCSSCAPRHPMPRSSRCTARDGEDGTVQELLEAIGIPYTGSGPAACMRCTDKVLAKHLMREAGIPTPDFHSFSEASFKQLGARRRSATSSATLGFPLVVKPASQGSALGVKFARSSASCRARSWRAFSYDRKVLLERYVTGRDLAVSVLDGPERRPASRVALPVVEAVPREEDFYDYESRYEIGMTTFVCPAELPAETTARAQELALETYRLLGCHGVARDRSDARRGQRRADGARGERRARA